MKLTIENFFKYTNLDDNVLKGSAITTREVSELTGDLTFFAHLDREIEKFIVLIIIDDEVRVYSSKDRTFRLFNDFKVILKHAKEHNAKTVFLDGFRKKDLPDILNELKKH
jgi:hypothetical protein